MTFVKGSSREERVFQGVLEIVVYRVLRNGKASSGLGVLHKYLQVVFKID